MADTWVCLLRGVNVGGRKVAMKDLKELFAGLGHHDVTTYIQSGNVVFRSDGGAPEKLGAAIEAAIADELGLEVTVLVRSPDDLRATIDANPFLAAGAEEAKLHVTFLDREPAPSKIAAVDPEAYPPDELAIVGRDVHLHCPDGYGRSKLTNAFWEKKLGVAATTRNWRTVNKLLQLATDG